jgi:NAD(P)-dependent dehydrogenase (short-subunit alcohol dehydrogenase family)
MSRIFITGSADGLGQMAARMLVAQGHQVVLHARHAARDAGLQDRLIEACERLSGVGGLSEEALAVRERY